MSLAKKEIVSTIPQENKQKEQKLLQTVNLKETSKFKKMSEKDFEGDKFVKLHNERKYIYEIEQGKQEQQGFYFSSDMKVDFSSFYIAKITLNGNLVPLNRFVVSVPPPSKSRDDYMVFKEILKPTPKRVGAFVFVRSLLILTPEQLKGTKSVFTSLFIYFLIYLILFYFIFIFIFYIFLFIFIYFLFILFLFILIYL